MGNPPTARRAMKNIAPGCVQLHQFGTPLKGRELRNRISGPLGLRSR